MALTVIGPYPAVMPLEYSAPVVQVKTSWSDEWEYNPELEIVTATWCAAGQDLSHCTLRRRYGPSVMSPHESVYSQRDAMSLDGKWIRVMMVGDEGALVQQFVGKVFGESRNVFGNAGGSRGVQTYPAVGPLQLLRKVEVFNSVWNEASVELSINWTPEMNIKDKSGMIVGNRSSNRLDDKSYVFGGEQLWSRYDYLEYILKQYVEQENGPVWMMTGQVELLRDYTDVIKTSIGDKASEIIRRIIPRNFGLDYTIDSTDDGFAIRVYALSAEAITFKDATLPANPLTVEIIAGETIDMDKVQIVAASEHLYDTVRLIGDRVVVVCSDDLKPKWSAEAETAYKAGTGTPADTPYEHDQARREDMFRSVYQLFGMPDDWDFLDGYATPIVAADGTITGPGADNQNTVRKTLSWTPLREGYDYTEEPPVNRNLAGVVAGFKPPLVIIQQEEWPVRYLPVDTDSMGVSVPKHDWGVFVNAYPNHKIAHGIFIPETSPTEKKPIYSYTTMEANFAFETDQRLILEYSLPESEQSGDGSVKEVKVRGAELWVMAPETLIGLNAGGNPVYSRDSYYILRNDSDRLSYLMAGAISRYLKKRARAAIPIKGALPWGDLIGSILTVIAEDDDAHEIQAPITSVEWHLDQPQPMTIIRAGFAK